ncbi:MAG TPA: hypothetical protein VMW87_05210 [Spirochaetia bacterium]|nr:hypothetical protein [Spirochaetia bacterium]
MSSISAKLYAFSMYAICTIVIFEELSGASDASVKPFEAFAMVLFLAGALVVNRGSMFWLTVAGLIAGHVLLLAYHLPFSAWIGSISASAGIVVLFVAIPFLTLPMSDSRYLDSLKNFIRNRSLSGGSKFVLLVFLHLCMTFVLNIASIPALQKILDRADLPKRYLVRLYTAGYASYMVSSPFDGVVNMTLLLASVSYGTYIVRAVPMVIAIVVVSVLLLPSLFRSRPQTAEEPSPARNGSSRGLLAFIAHVMVMIALVAAGNLFLHFRTPTLMTAILIALYALGWTGALGKIRLWTAELRSHNRRLLEYVNFLPFLVAMNFFGAVLAQTPAKAVIGSSIHELAGLFPQYFALQIILGATVLLSLLGVHMMITITALAFSVAHASLGLTPSAYALFLLTCWYVAMSISPFVPFSAVVADAVGAKPFEVTFKYNLLFAAAMTAAGPAVVLLANRI